MPDEQRTLVLKQMLAHHETNFGPDLWAEARSDHTKWAVDAIVFSLNTWDDRLQQWTHSNEFFTNGDFRNAVCERLGCDYDSLSEDLPDKPDRAWTFAKLFYAFMALNFLIGVIRFLTGWHS